MKIAIISDTHDNLANFRKIIEWLNNEKIKLILHCGDVSSQETLNEIKKLFDGEIKIVRGNADVNLIDIPEFSEIELKSGLIVFTHFPDKARQLIETKKYKIVFYGHTHRPWKESIGDCLLINPGEAGGQFYKPTFAIYDTEKDKIELKILERLK